jgi:DnaJ family protein A protein 5
VLSDPHERAWYDSHREAILCNDDVDSSGDQYAHNVKLTSALDIISLMGKFSSSVPFTDAPDGFYGRLRSLFTTIADEEITVCEWENLQIVEYPDFGSARDSYEDVVKPFYAAWAGFSTKKSFSWCDVHNYVDAPDRRIRRLMEKENKRLRDEGIRQFNDAVRNLVSFVRRRDPRYIPNTQTEADRQKILRDAAAAQAARSRAAYQAKFDEHVVPAWAQTQNQNQEEEGKFSDSEESEVEEIECVICNKLFKSEKQYEAHEKSKKHIKAVQQLKRQMQKENKKLNLDGDQTPNSRAEFTLVEEEEPLDEEAQPSEDSESEEPAVEDLSNQGVDPEVENSVPTSTSSSFDLRSMNAPEIPETEQELDDEYAPREEVETRFSKLGISTRDQLPLHSDGEQDSCSKEASQKLGKAKAKRAKKAARQEASDKSQVRSLTPG